MPHGQLDLSVDGSTRYLSQRFGPDVTNELRYAEALEDWAIDETPGVQGNIQSLATVLSCPSTTIPFDARNIENFSVVLSALSAAPRTRLLVHLIDRYGPAAMEVMSAEMSSDAGRAAAFVVSEFVQYLDRKKVLDMILNPDARPSAIN